MRASYLDLICKKRDGVELSTDEIEHLVHGISSGSVPGHQIGALLMAIYLQGLSRRETFDLTMAMVRSGDVLDLSDIEGFKADKHSTGGVGDKVTLVVAPLVAAAGIKVPKLSGRGLAHTGGTLDKLESIPGMRVDLTLNELKEQVNAIGLAVSGQTKQLVPADGVIYGLRDQTGTVDSVPLIASSVMSKKIAAGADGIMLDVKCGSGAFMKTQENAEDLARQMVDIGRQAGKETRAVVTPMENPLGCTVGNALEVREAIETLRGHGPEDLLEECLAIGAAILRMAEPALTLEWARRRLTESLDDGAALHKLREMIEWQDGEPAVVHDLSLLPRAAQIVEVSSERSGHVQRIDALSIGAIAMELGAGRRAKDDAISPSAGIVLRARPSQDGFVREGSILAELHVPRDCDARTPIEKLESRLRQAYVIGADPPEPAPSVLAHV